MIDITFIRLLFVAGLLGLAAVAMLVGYVVARFQDRPAGTRAHRARGLTGPAAGGAARMWKTLL